MTTIFIAWEKYHARTTLLGKALGARVYFVSRLGRVGGPLLLLKYALQSLDTLVILLRCRPDVVLVQTPPVFVALLATLWSRVYPRTRIIIDSHSGNFFSRKWRWILPLHRWCSRRAAMNLVHMPSLLAVMRQWGARAMEMGYVFEERPPSESQAYPLPAGTHVVVPSSFNADEPVDLVFAAAKQLPDIKFHLTGNADRLPPALRAQLPANVSLTGYLTVEAYFGLLRSATAVLALTTQDQTFQTGGAEAVWLGRPLILSDWPELRQVFSRGAVFVAHTPESLAAGVRAVQAQPAALAREMSQLKLEFDRDLQARLRRLSAFIRSEATGVRPAWSDRAAGEES